MSVRYVQYSRQFENTCKCVLLVAMIHYRTSAPGVCGTLVVVSTLYTVVCMSLVVKAKSAVFILQGLS